MINSPCYKCEKRHSGCHSECDEYAEYRAKLDELSKSERSDVYTAYITKSIYTRRKKKNERNRG